VEQHSRTEVQGAFGKWIDVERGAIRRHSDRGFDIPSLARDVVPETHIAEVALQIHAAVEVGGEMILKT
jgi:hypothetical protein